MESGATISPAIHHANGERSLRLPSSHLNAYHDSTCASRHASTRAPSTNRQPSRLEQTQDRTRIRHHRLRCQHFRSYRSSARSRLHHRSSRSRRAYLKNHDLQWGSCHGTRRLSVRLQCPRQDLRHTSDLLVNNHLADRDLLLGRGLKVIYVASCGKSVPR